MAIPAVRGLRSGVKRDSQLLEFKATKKIALSCMEWKVLFGLKSPPSNFVPFGVHPKKGGQVSFDAGYYAWDLPPCPVPSLAGAQ